MRLVSVSEAWWVKYVDICFHRKYTAPWPTRTMFLVAEGDELVSGVCIYDTAGPHVFFEHLVTNETAPLRLRHAAVKLMAKEMISYARTVGKIPHILVRLKGIERILRSVGLVPSGLQSFTCPIETLEGKNEHPFHSAKHPRSQPNSAHAVQASEGDPEDGSGVRPEVPGG